MSENWCGKHNTAWFKTDKMRSYAHPIKDGEITIAWCNKPENAEPPKDVATCEKPKGDAKNRAFAASYVKDLVIAGVVDYNNMITHAKRVCLYLDTGEQ